LVSFYSFLSLHIVNDKIKIVIVASEVAKSEASEKLKNDVRKNTRQKKLCVVGFSVGYLLPVTNF